ncbi:histone deacetylase family protein [Massilia sp. S19_KUP03_FR1]|uniref:histone deacetylase family protein n=1 Tax=Massilia sp. S19_KUP03_FR1 TaxID=3025503 RepID=UPI002FCDA0EC
MLTFYNEHHAQHHGRSGVVGANQSAYREVPQRADLVVSELKRRGLGQIVIPHGVSLASLERVHTARYLHFLRHAWQAWLALDATNAGRDAFAASWPVRAMRVDLEPEGILGRLGLFSTDATTPLMAGTWMAAKAGADCAINAAHALRLGERGSFALTRPPGQHAGADYYGGACFLNNAALAAQHLLDDGVKRVAILDIGYHHGNGTQDIFYARKDVLVTSIHVDPRTSYPFYAGHADETGIADGLGLNLNVPLAPGSNGAQWFAALETACLKIAMYGAEAIVVSLGVDTFSGDPASRFGLASADFLRIGERIAHLDLPVVFVLEGGSVVAELGTNVVNVLEGFETAN